MDQPNGMKSSSLRDGTKKGNAGNREVMPDRYGMHDSPVRKGGVTGGEVLPYLREQRGWKKKRPVQAHIRENRGLIGGVGHDPIQNVLDKQDGRARRRNSLFRSGIVEKTKGFSTDNDLREGGEEF